VGNKEDGDILNAISSLDTRRHHLGKICHLRKHAKVADSLSYRFIEQNSKFKFERLSTYTVRRTNLITSDTDELSNTPNAQGERIDLPTYLARRKSSPNHGIFGDAGSEIWFGGVRDPSHTDLDDLWAVVESQTAYREVDFADWPLNPREIAGQLWIRTTDFTQDEVRDLVSLISDVDQRRRYMVSWRSVTGVSAFIDRILDRKDSIDLRVLAPVDWTQRVVDKTA